MEQNGELKAYRRKIKIFMFASYYKKILLEIQKTKARINKLQWFSTHQKLLRDQLAVTVIIDCGTTESCKFKRKIGFTLHDVFNTKEQTTLALIKNTFEGGNMQTPTQYYVQVFLFLITSLPQKLMNLVIVIEIMMKQKKGNRRRT